jgi:DNA-binding transcriptional ArsR family regulator
MAAAADMSTLMRTLGDPTRRVLFERIVQGEDMTVSALVRGGSISQPAVSQHLKALREAGLVTERREGRNAHYRAVPGGLAPLVDWLDHYGVFWRERFAKLDKLLKEIDP